ASSASSSTSAPRASTVPLAPTFPPIPSLDIQVTSSSSSSSGFQGEVARQRRLSSSSASSTPAAERASPGLDPGEAAGNGNDEEEFDDAVDGAGASSDSEVATGPDSETKAAKKRKALVEAQAQANRDTIPREIGNRLGNSIENLANLEGWLEENCRPYSLGPKEDAALLENARSRMTTLRKGQAAQLAHKCGFHVVLFMANPRGQVAPKRPRKVDMDWYACPALRAQDRFQDVGQALAYMEKATTVSRKEWAAMSAKERAAMVEVNRLAEEAKDKAEMERDAAEAERDEAEERGRE
ncbi:hypothetical protein P7C70_g9610, partial [Phenoliferia sp. Uapishka_3]